MKEGNVFFVLTMRDLFKGTAMRPLCAALAYSDIGGEVRKNKGKEEKGEEDYELLSWFAPHNVQESVLVLF